MSNSALTISAYPQSWTVDLNSVTSGMLGGLTAGLVAGGLARAAMRIVALVAGQVPEFNLLATIAILLLFATFGMVLALLYLAVQPLLRARRVWKSLAFGLLLACLTAWLFFQTDDGELGIVAPWIGAALFAPIPLVYSLVLELMLRRAERRTGPARPVHWAWFGLFVLALSLAFWRMMAGQDGAVRTPAAIQAFYRTMGVGFGDLAELNALLNFFYALLYCGLCATLFRLGYRHRAALATAIGLLMLGGGIWSINLLLPRSTTYTAGAPLEWTAWMISALAWGGALWGLTWRQSKSQHRWQGGSFGWLVSALGLAVGAFLLLWVAILLFPGLQLRRLTGLQAAFAVPLFLGPWLLAPATVVYALRRGQLWSTP